MTNEFQSNGSSFNKLLGLSDELAALVETASRYVVRVEDGSRLTGSGVVWSDDGIIVTSSHGLERDEDLSVALFDGSTLGVTLVGRDPESDIAVLKSDSTGLAAAPKTTPGQVKVGSLAVAVARPGRQGLQATLGLVTSLYEVETNGRPEHILGTDAVLYPGFSGGPLVAADGNTAGMVNRWFGRGSGLALGVSIVDHVVASLQAHGRVKRGFLGIRTQIVALPPGLQSLLEREQEYGLLIVQVEPGSPADSSGVLLGDILVGIDADPLVDVESLRKHLQAGKKITVHTLRGGERRSAEVTVAAQN